MACAKCAFYLLKAFTKAQILDAKTNLLQIRVDIPSADAELSAVEDGSGNALLRKWLTYRDLLLWYSSVVMATAEQPRMG
jgi:hypothetical protein